MGFGWIVGAVVAAGMLAATPAMADGMQERSRALPPAEPGLTNQAVASPTARTPRVMAAAFSTAPAHPAFTSRAVEMSPAAVVRGMDYDDAPPAGAARTRTDPAPTASRPVRPASPVSTSSVSSEVRCVAMAVFHEARGEPLRGQRAVADVVMNRARSGRWGGACGVVDAPLQFSHRRSWTWPVAGVPAWDRAIGVARDAVSGVVGVSSRISNFHAAGLGGSGMRLGGHVFW